MTKYVHRIVTFELLSRVDLIHCFSKLDFNSFLITFNFLQPNSTLSKLICVCDECPNIWRTKWFGGSTICGWLKRARTKTNALDFCRVTMLWITHHDRMGSLQMKVLSFQFRTKYVDLFLIVIRSILGLFLVQSPATSRKVWGDKVTVGRNPSSSFLFHQKVGQKQMEQEEQDAFAELWHALVAMMLNYSCTFVTTSASAVAHFVLLFRHKQVCACACLCVSSLCWPSYYTHFLSHHFHHHHHHHHHGRNPLFRLRGEEIERNHSFSFGFLSFFVNASNSSRLSTIQLKQTSKALKKKDDYHFKSKSRSPKVIRIRQKRRRSDISRHRVSILGRPVCSVESTSNTWNQN